MILIHIPDVSYLPEKTVGIAMDSKERAFEYLEHLGLRSGYWLPDSPGRRQDDDTGGMLYYRKEQE